MQVGRLSESGGGQAIDLFKAVQSIASGGDRFLCLSRGVASCRLLQASDELSGVLLDSHVL